MTIFKIQKTFTNRDFDVVQFEVFNFFIEDFELIFIDRFHFVIEAAVINLMSKFCNLDYNFQKNEVSIISFLMML